MRFHRLGIEPARDPVVRPATGTDGTFEIPSLSPDGRWLLIVRILGPSGRTPYLGAAREDGTVRRWVSMAPSRSRITYDVAFGKSAMFVTTNEGAPRGRAFRVEARRPTREAWKEIQPPRRDATLSGITPVGDFVVYEYAHDAETQYEIRRATGELVKTIAAAVGESMTSLTGDPESDEATIAMGSYTRPYGIGVLRAPTFELEAFPPSAPPSANDDDVTEKTYYTASDGTRAPVFVVRARTTPARGDVPLILSGYGGFGLSTTPSYRRDLRVWLDRGGVYAEAVLRGGGEFGSEWRHAGMGKGRKNVYDDFIAASEKLVDERWTSPDKFLIRGASAGGLLVAVAETERPDLYRGVIAQVPLSDMVRYPLGHDSGTLWLEEYGSPSKPDEFEVLYRFSPYHRVRPNVRYPATLILASEKDQRLDPMHGRKLAAALGEADACGDVLLRVERDGGHSGSTLASGWLEETADLYAFAASLVGMTK